MALMNRKKLSNFLIAFSAIGNTPVQRVSNNFSNLAITNFIDENHLKLNLVIPKHPLDDDINYLNKPCWADMYQVDFKKNQLNFNLAYRRIQK